MITVNDVEFEFREDAAMLEPFVKEVLRHPKLVHLKGLPLMYVLNDTLLYTDVVRNTKLADGDNIRLLVFGKGG